MSFPAGKELYNFDWSVEIAFKESPNFFDPGNKAKLVTASFSCFLELSWKVQLINIIAMHYYCYKAL